MKIIVPPNVKKVNNSLTHQEIAKRQRRKVLLLWQGQQLQDFSLFRLICLPKEVNND